MADITNSSPTDRDRDSPYYLSDASNEIPSSPQRDAPTDSTSLSIHEAPTNTVLSSAVMPVEKHSLEKPGRRKSLHVPNSLGPLSAKRWNALRPHETPQESTSELLNFHHRKPLAFS